MKFQFPRTLRAKLSILYLQAFTHKEAMIQDSGDAYLPVIKTTASAQWSVVILLSQSEINAQLQWLYEWFYRSESTGGA
jgi:hypothetical protein